jgi:3-hydroxy-3-methylglutaryl CoA synthase
MAEIIRYGSYVPKYRAPLSEIQSFYGRPGRPRSRALATPALDEDSLTMAYEAGFEALAGQEDPAVVVTLSMSPPFGLRKMSATLARALDLPKDTTHYDVAGHPGSLLDAIDIAGALAARDGATALVVVSDHQVSYEDRVCDLLSAGGATALLVGGSGGFATLGPIARASNEVYDVWRLGTEGEARYRLEVLFDAYGKAARGAFAALERLTERPVSGYAAVCPSQPHPQTLRNLGRLGVTEKQIEDTSFVASIGNLGAASLGLALALGFDGARKGQRLLAFGYGGGEGIAQSIEIAKAPPKIGIADRVAAGEAITLGTYYRWTKGRQQQPH